MRNLRRDCSLCSRERSPCDGRVRRRCDGSVERQQCTRSPTPSTRVTRRRRPPSRPIRRRRPTRSASCSTASARTPTSRCPTVDHKDNDATLRLAATWKFGKDGRNQWTYATTGSASQNGDEWKIRWDPATVAPGLGTGPLSYSTLTPDPAAQVLDRTGAELLTQQVVTLVNVSPGADVNAVAALLNPIDAGITAQSLQSQLSAANGQPVTAVTLRAEDLAPIEEALSAMPNVTLAPQARLLTTDKALTSPTLSGLSDLWQHATDDAAGWAVSAQTATGSQRVGGQDPKPVADIASTLDIGMSRAAEDALAADCPRRPRWS